MNNSTFTYKKPITYGLQLCEFKHCEAFATKIFYNRNLCALHFKHCNDFFNNNECKGVTL